MEEEQILLVEKITKLEGKVKEEKFISLVRALVGGFVLMCAITGSTSLSEFKNIEKLIATYALCGLGAASGFEFKRMVESVLKKHTYETELEKTRDELFGLMNKKTK